jgi:hypothetical protein
LQSVVAEQIAPELEQVPRPSKEVGLEEGDEDAEMEGGLLLVTEGDWLAVTEGGLLPVTEGEDDPVIDGLEEGPDEGLPVTQTFSTQVSPGPSQPQTKWHVSEPWHDPMQQPLSLTQSVGWLH